MQIIPKFTVTQNNCKGLIFRAHVHSFISSHRSIEVKKSLRLLKRKSCKGCKHCEWIWDEMMNEILDCEIEDFAGDIENGKKYKLNAVWSPGTYEYPDDGDMNYSFTQWEEKKANCMKIFDHYDPCPDCGSQLRAKGLNEGGGIICPNKKCSYWFCY